MRRMHAAVAFHGVLVALGWSAPVHAEQGVLCRWGPPSDMAPVPDCGVPREVQVAVPARAWKFYFAVDANPGLKGYYHSPKAGGPLRPFKRKINLVNSKLYLCPADFQKERILAFEVVDRRRRLLGRPTCRLGKPESLKPRPAPSASKPSEEAKPRPRPGRASTSVARPLLEQGRPEPWRKVDRLARAMGLAALILAILSLVGLAVLVRFCQKRMEALGAGGGVARDESADEVAEGSDARES